MRRAFEKQGLRRNMTLRSRVPRPSVAIRRVAAGAEKFERLVVRAILKPAPAYSADLPGPQSPPDLAAGLALIAAASMTELASVSFLERQLIPALGLNDEYLHEQSRSLRCTMGRGHGWRIWQYPNQFARYLHLLSRLAPRINSYIEIGSRFGGTFVLTCEMLRRFNPHFQSATAVDLIPCPPLIQSYVDFAPFKSAEYFQGNSAEDAFAAFIADRHYDLALIDGDHFTEGLLTDFRTMRERGRYLVFHDITSRACPDVTAFWRAAKAFLPRAHFAEFVDQYPDTDSPGPYLGIGIMSETDSLT